MADKKKKARRVTAKEFSTIVFAEWGRKCYFCDGPATDPMHIYPRSMLGVTARYACAKQNGRPGCRKCHDGPGASRLSFKLADQRMAYNALQRVLKAVRLPVPA